MNSTTIDEIKQYFEPTDSKSSHKYNCDIACEKKNAGIFLKALKEGIKPNYKIINLKNSNYKNEINLITAFFIACSTKELKQEEQYFKDNIDNPIFQALLFTADIVSAEAKLADKIKYLLSLGYNPNVAASHEMEISKKNHRWEKPEDSANMTPLHYLQNKKALEYLLNAGADLTIKANVLISHDLVYAIEKGITHFNDEKDLQNYAKEMYDKKIVTKNEFENLMTHKNKFFIDLYNEYLNDYHNPLTAIELAKKSKQKGKFLLLEKYNHEKTPDEKVEEIKSLWENKKKRPALSLFTTEMKNDNPALLNRLEEFKEIVLTTQTQNNMVNQMIYNQQIKWLDKVFDDHISDDSFRGYGDTSYLVYAANKRKTQTFIHLYKKGITSDLDKFIASTTEAINRLEDNVDVLNKDCNCLFPVLIVDFLVSEGYEFGSKNKVILGKIINQEKQKIEKFLQNEVNDTTPSTDIPKKKMKL
jgi:hypothetical protein